MWSISMIYKYEPKRLNSRNLANGVLTIAAFCFIVMVLRWLGIETELFDFIGRMTTIFVVLYLTDPIAKFITD